MSYIAAVSKACTSYNCSSPTNMVGIWASEFSIESISVVLEHLKDGFVGSLAVVDTNTIVLASSSGQNLVPALTTSDSSIQEASKAAFSVGKELRAKATTLIGHNIIGFIEMNFTDYPDANGKYNAIMSFGREQMFKEYDEARNNGLALLTIGVVVLALFIEVSTSKSRARLTTIKIVNREIQQIYMNIIDQDDGAVKKRLRLQKYIELLIPDPPQHTTFSHLQPDKPLENYYQDSVIQLGTRQQRAILATMTPREQATSMATMSPREQATALAIMSPRQQATTLARMSPDEQASILSIMSPRERGAALATMSPRNEHAALEVLSSIRSSSNPNSAGWSACKGPSGAGTGLSVPPLNLAEVTDPITPMQALPVIGADSHEIDDARSNYASLFLEDALSQRDAKLRLAISSRSTTTQSLLLPLFMLVNAPAYGVGFDCAFIAGMLICWTDVNWTVVEIMLLLFLVADVITSIILSRMIKRARSDARMKGRKSPT